MIPAYSDFLLFFISLCWMASCSGYMLNADDTDADDIWPVLCPPDTYYSKKQDRCLPCSQCPMNKIITMVCHGLHDTKCGPFYDFKDLTPLNAASSKDKLDQLSNNVHPKHIAENGDLLSDARKDLKDAFTHFEKTPNDVLELTDSEWKYLTISLLVCLLLFVVAIFGLGFCLYKRRVANEKKVVCDYSPPPEVV